MSKFQVGDRVRVYHRHTSFTGKVDAIDEKSGALYVIEDGHYSCHNLSPFHLKQCRKLKKKKRREIWVSTQIEQSDFDSSARCSHMTLKEPPVKGWLRFVEAPEKDEK